MDTIADFLTRIRNANAKMKERVDIPFSKMKLELARVLKEEGYISNYKSLYNESRRGVIRVFLKYTPEKETVIKGLRRVSKPGCRVYRPYTLIKPPRGSFGISIMSTSNGVMTDEDAKSKKVGGEVICQVW